MLQHFPRFEGGYDIVLDLPFGRSTDRCNTFPVLKGVMTSGLWMTAMWARLQHFPRFEGGYDYYRTETGVTDFCCNTFPVLKGVMTPARPVVQPRPQSCNTFPVLKGVMTSPGELPP